MTLNCKELVKSHWNIFYIFNNNKYYIEARVPTQEHYVYRIQRFHCTDLTIKKVIEDAIVWQTKIGTSIWGEDRFHIAKTQWRNSKRLTSKNQGVGIILTGDDRPNGRYEYWHVYWYEHVLNDECALSRKKRSKNFTKKRYGTLTKARIAAEYFAAKKRIELVTHPDKLSSAPISTSKKSMQPNGLKAEGARKKIIASLLAER